MVPHQAPLSAASTLNTSFPPLNRANTLPAPSLHRATATDRSLLAPEDAIYAGSPPRRQSAAVSKLQKDLRMTNGGGDGNIRSLSRGRHKLRTARSGSRRRKGAWKKLLWVKQTCLFFDCLSRNSANPVSRSGQLYRSRYIPRTSTTQPSTSTLRLLAIGRRLNRNCPACLLSHNICGVLRWYLPGASLSGGHCDMGEHRHSTWVGALGLVG
jgi:hypothetical protein